MQQYTHYSLNIHMLSDILTFQPDTLYTQSAPQ